MKPYVRPQEPLTLESSATWTRPAAATPARFPKFWGDFTAHLQRALERDGTPQEQSAFGRLIHCGSRQIERVYRCLTEEEAIEAWCGHAWCPACAAQQAAQAARYVQEAWDERVLHVGITVGTGGDSSPGLPEKTAIAKLRAAWSSIGERAAEISGFPRLAKVPRVIVTPAGMHMFVRLPWGALPEGQVGEHAPAALVEAVRSACQGAGIYGARVQVASREAAAQIVRSALLEESRRFTDRVGYDLARMASVRWRTPGAASVSERPTGETWLEALRGAQRDRRRKRVLGGKGALPMPACREIEVSKPVCPRHGGICAVDETRIRERFGADVLHSVPGDQVPAAHRTSIAHFVDQAPSEVSAERPIARAA